MAGRSLWMLSLLVFLSLQVTESRFKGHAKRSKSRRRSKALASSSHGNTTAVPSAQCFSLGDDGLSIASSGYEWFSSDGYLNVEGSRFHLKGASWFGFETSENVAHGLWAQDYHWFVDFLANYSFNAVRLPFSVQGAQADKAPTGINTNDMNEDIGNLTSMEIMDAIIAALGDAGILVMLDMHSLEDDGYLADGLWYDDDYPMETGLAVWEAMVDRYKGYWNVFAIDVFNEPFDGTWGANTSDTDWPSWCETVGNKVHSLGVDWLVFCEGVSSSPSCADACFWGEDLEGVKNDSVKLDKADKVVYSPHVYGPSVASQDYFDADDFPDNMPAIWDKHFGFIRGTEGAATVTGEWGGFPEGDDLTWLNAFAAYLVDTDIPDNFFWCLNSDSGDTGGLLDNWSSPNEARLDIAGTAQPNPTKITNEKDKVCFYF